LLSVITCLGYAIVHYCAVVNPLGLTWVSLKAARFDFYAVRCSIETERLKALVVVCTMLFMSVLDTETKLVPMVKNVVLTPPDYDRDIRHYEFDIHGLGMGYSPGDCLGR